MVEPAHYKTHTYTYNTPGTYTVTETVTGPGGNNTATQTNLITVFNSTPPNVQQHRVAEPIMAPKMWF